MPDGTATIAQSPEDLRAKVNAQVIEALNIKWAETVISEVASAPKGRFNDLCDTVSAALIHMRDHGLLSLGEEFRREVLDA